MTDGLATPAPLALRHDDGISFGMGLKVMLITALLLALAYVVLRWVAQRQHRPAGLSGQPELRCSQALRLSAKTRVYLLQAGDTRLVLTESASGAALTVLPASASPSPIVQS